MYNHVAQRLCDRYGRKEPFDVYWRILSYMHVIYDNILQYRVFFFIKNIVVDLIAGGGGGGRWFPVRFH